MALDPQVATALNGVLVTVIGVAGTALAVLGAWGLSILERKLGIEKDDRAKATIETAISNGISTAAKVVAARVVDPNSRVGDPQAEVARLATLYAEPKVGDEMKRLAIDPASLPGRVGARVAAVMPTLRPDATEHAITEALNAAQLAR